MKKTILFSCMLVSSLAYSQVGINTSNPQGVFHIDGAKDNPQTGTPNANQQTNDMIVTTAGNVGVGTTSPENKFHIVTTTPNRSRYTLIDAPIGTEKYTILALRNTSPVAVGNYALLGFTNNGSTSGGANWGIGSIRTTTGEDFYMGNSIGGNYIERFRIISSGNVGIGTSTPTEKLHVIGNILASGTVTPSDIRIKKDITDNTYGLNEILNLRTINYQYKDERLSKGKKLGFVAQEIQKTMPELVTTANDEMKTLGLNYAEMTVVLTKAIQEQQEMIVALKEEIETLKKNK